MCTGALPCKIILGVLNALVILVGLVIVALGIIGYIGLKQYPEIDANAYLVCLIILGIFLVVIPCLGCVGAFGGLKLILKIYMGIMVILSVVQLINIILLYVYLSPSEIDKKVDSYFEDYWKDEEVKKNLDEIQRRLKCCGVSGVKFYEGKELPPACCGLNEPEKCTEDKAYTKGCLHEQLKQVKSAISTLKIFCIVCFLVEVGCAVLAFFIIRF